ncbi:MAG: glycosyl hydrolase [Planctomycetota bacterium]|jgi:hypothetical protein
MSSARDVRDVNNTVCVVIVPAWIASFLVAATLAVSASYADQPQSDLAQRFAGPPNSAKPRVFWWWLNSNVTKAGITRDLEEMKRQGIGGAMIFDAGGAAGSAPSGPRFMGPEWREMVKHAVTEADRLGMEISVNLCSGWDSGGPWVTPEFACQKVVWSQTVVQGPRVFSDVLPLPDGIPTERDGRPVYYRDIAVQALPAAGPGPISMEAASPKVTASSSQRSYPARNSIDGTVDTFWVSDGRGPSEGPSKLKPEWLQLEFAVPFVAASLYVSPRTGYGPRECELQTSDDGKTFTTVCRFAVKVNEQSKRIPFAQTRSRIFRLLITSAYSFGREEEPAWNVQIRELAILREGETYRQRFPLMHWRLKSANQYAGPTASKALEEEYPEVPDEVHVRSNQIVDLTEKLDAAGRLRWDVPPGKWSILRIGHTLTGMRVSTCSPGGEGYMLDYLSAQAMELQFESMAAKILEDVGHLAGKSLKYFHDDSWEVGTPNWTPRFPTEFRKRRGYDLLPYLAVLAGKIVDSRDVSNRFLWDFRKTVGECIADNHYGRLRDLSHQHGINIHPESGGPFFPHIDALQCLGRNDIPMTEFWQDDHWMSGSQNIVGKQAASAAHIYGKKLVNAEAFTSIGPHWEEGPFEMKPVADRAFCEGINRFFFHTFTHSSPDAGKPGYEYFAGTHFNPNITWWEQAGAFTDYISRCQFLLQQGLFVADVCYYYGEGVPNFAPPKHVDPSLGTGYDYDTCNAEVLLSRMTVKHRRIELPDGMSYHLLVLPELSAMSPDVLRKITAMVEAGATVVGPKPSKAPGLRDYPRADEVVRELADKLWGPCDGERVHEHSLGKGRIVWGKALREILLSDGVGPDFQFTGSRRDANLDCIHRSIDDAEVYFVANRKNRAEHVQCTFRVKGKAPELWMPDTGEIRPQAVYDPAEDGTTLPLYLDPWGSVFVVFRATDVGDRVVSVTKDGKSPFPEVTTPANGFPSVEVLPSNDARLELRVWKAGTYELKGLHGKIARASVESIPAALEISGAWLVRFSQGWGAPEHVTFEELASWTEHSNPGVRYFSGTATYRREFDLPRVLFREPTCLFLDLGVVKNIAEVTVNGENLRILWKPPFRVEITDAIRPGKNLLEVKVTNLWPNRLIGDQFLPEGKRFTLPTSANSPRNLLY